MFELKVTTADGRKAWTTDRKEWSTPGGSFVRPFLNPALETKALQAPGMTLFISRERLSAGPKRPQPAALETVSRKELLACLDAQAEHPLDYCAVLVVGGREPRCEVRCGQWGSAPLYLIDPEDDVLHGHWHPARLYQLLRRKRIDLSMFAASLVGREPIYSTHTYYTDIRRVTERARAIWDGRTLTIEEPAKVTLMGPGRWEQGVDPVGLYLGLAQACMNRRAPGLGRTISCELSGGLDSALVAGLATRCGAVRSYGMIMAGRNGRLQTTRRRTMTRIFGLEDTTVNAAEWLPLVDPERESVVPWGEFYHSATSAMLDRAVADGATAMLTGIGGDELSPIFAHEAKADPAEANETPHPAVSDLAREMAKAVPAGVPPGTIPASALSAADCCGHFFMQHGLWPVHPLMSPSLVRISQRLPLESRRGRELQRQVLGALGLPKSATHPKETENFREISERALRRSARKRLRELFAECRLAELGLIDADKLRRCYDQFIKEGAGKNEEASFFLMQLASFEQSFRAFANA